MNALQFIQLTIAFAGLTLALITFLRKRDVRDILLVLIGLVLLVILLSLVGLVN